MCDNSEEDSEKKEGGGVSEVVQLSLSLMCEELCVWPSPEPAYKEQAPRGHEEGEGRVRGTIVLMLETDHPAWDGGKAVSEWGYPAAAQLHRGE